MNNINPTIRPLLVELLRRIDAGEKNIFDGIERRDPDGHSCRYSAECRGLVLSLNSTYTIPPAGDAAREGGAS